MCYLKQICHCDVSHNVYMLYEGLGSKTPASEHIVQTNSYQT